MSGTQRNDGATGRPDGRPETPTAYAATKGKTTREEVVDRERERFGGFKFGSAFFGWLTATGMTVILTAIVGATGAAIGLGAEPDPAQAAEDAASNAATVGIVGAIVLAVVLFVAYYCGGYVASRMARFSGLKQGLAVWLWAVLIAIVAAVLGLVAGSQFNVLSDVNAFPRIPIDEGALTVGGIVTAVVAVLVALGGALLGGVAGMRYHRRVDKEGLGR